MSGHGNTWGHVRCLRRGPHAGAGVVFLVPVKVFCKVMDYAWEVEDAMSSHMSGWGVSKHIEMCLWALPLLCSVLWPGLVWSPLPSQLPVLLVPFCYVGLGEGMQIPG